MNLFLILIPQSLNSQFLNLAPYSHYNEDGVQKSDLVRRSNNEVWMSGFMIEMLISRVLLEQIVTIY